LHLDVEVAGGNRVTLYQILLFVHILAGVVWVGGVIHTEALQADAQRSGDGRAVVQVSATNRKWFLIPSLVVIVFGVWLTVEAGRSFSELWVWASLAGTILAAVFGALVLSREGLRVAAIYDERGADDANVRDRIGRLARLRHGHTALLVLLLALMIWKPGA
jgi:uncharacterized membrane protein